MLNASFSTMSWPKANKDRQSTGLMHMGTKLDSIHDMNFGLGIAIKKYRKNWYQGLLLDFRTNDHITKYILKHFKVHRKVIFASLCIKLKIQLKFLKLNF